MSSLTIITTPTGGVGHASGTRRNRRMSVNERVDRILQGSLLQNEVLPLQCDESDEEAKSRNRQIASLYNTSINDRLVKSRSRVDHKAAKSVPMHMHLVPPLRGSAGANSLPLGDTTIGSTSSLPISPIKPVKCYAKFMLEQVHDQEELEQEQRMKKEFLPPEFESPKPWYHVCSSPHKVPTGTLDAKVRRYGAYGVIKMMATESIAGTVPPFKLHESQSLEGLMTTTKPNPWSPTLRGSPSQWQKNLNHHFKMGRSRSPNLQKTQDARTHDIQVLEHALDQEKVKRRLEIEYNQAKFAHWQQHHAFEPRSNRIEHPLTPVHLQPVHALTILHHPDDDVVSRQSQHFAKLMDNRFVLRWRNMAILLDTMKRTTCRRPVLQDIDKLYGLCYQLSLQNRNAWELNRQQFGELLLREYPMMELKYVNRLYSSYDVAMEDRLDMRMFLATVRALRVQQGKPMEMLCMALLDFDITKRNVVTNPDHFKTVVSLCAASNEEEEEMHRSSIMFWNQMTQQYATEREHRRQQRLRGIEVKDDALDIDGELSEEKGEIDDTESDIDSILFLGKEEDQMIPIKFVRKAMRQEQTLLNRFSEMLLNRRDECFLNPPPKTPSNDSASANELQ